ncbi:MAG: Holliday junction branch migration DNA helicase RuvB, partial [Bacteroidia bacterium]|nr:Holliday junction branch migration DNA helicase RuvB [Bacteroidia bacterium]
MKKVDGNLENFDPRKEVHFSDSELEGVIRPKEFEDFSGQDKILKNLKVFVKAAKSRGESLDHVLFYGPPG